MFNKDEVITMFSKLHNLFVNFMYKVDTKTNHLIYKWDAAPCWLEYSLEEEINGDLVKVHYRCGVAVYAKRIGQ